MPTLISQACENLLKDGKARHPLQEGFIYAFKKFAEDGYKFSDLPWFRASKPKRNN